MQSRASSAKMVMQPTGASLVGGSNPGPRSAEFCAAAAAAARSQRTRIRTTDRKLCVGCVTIQPEVVLWRQAFPLLAAF